MSKVEHSIRTVDLALIAASIGGWILGRRSRAATALPYVDPVIDLTTARWQRQSTRHAAPRDTTAQGRLL